MAFAARKFRKALWLLLPFSVLFSTSASALEVKRAYDVFPSLRKNVSCMVSALKAIPNIDKVETGIFEDGIWDYPLIRYRYTDRKAGVAIIEFRAHKNDTEDPRYQIDFQAGMSGLNRPVSAPDFGREKVVRLWREKCGVPASVFFN
jgi:hypothetical protein